MRLGRDLGVAVKHDRVDLADRVLGGGRIVGRADDELGLAAADRGAVGHDVEAGAVAVGREEPQRLMVGLLGLADLLGQADRGQRAADAEPLVLGDRRPLGRSARSRRAVAMAVGQICPRLVVDRHADGDVVGVVADAALGDGWPVVDAIRAA